MPRPVVFKRPSCANGPQKGDGSKKNQERERGRTLANNRAIKFVDSEADVPDEMRRGCGGVGGQLVALQKGTTTRLQLSSQTVAPQGPAVLPSMPRHWERAQRKRVCPTAANQAHLFWYVSFGSTPASRKYFESFHDFAHVVTCCHCVFE